MTETQSTYETPNVPVRQGARDLAINPNGGLMVSSYMELMQMAALYHKSGMAPGSLDSVEKIAIGMATCLEIGVPIVTGLQHVAVINGRASIWGDLVMSLVQGSGLLEEFQESETGTPFQDDWLFTCNIKRKGRAPAIGKFSWAEAKRAGLTDPQRRQGGGPDIFSPWRRFPRRMMMWAARRWVIRDQFADVLKGIVMAEDALDTIEMGRGLDGSYRAATVPGPTPGNGEQNAEMPKGKPVYEVKDVPAEADPTPEPQPEAPKAEAVPETLPEAQPEPKQEPPPPFDPWARENWIRLKSSGYPTHVFTHKDTFTAAPKAIREEAIGKWLAMFPDKPWPINPPAPEPAPQPEPFRGNRLADEGPPPGVNLAGKPIDDPPPTGAPAQTFGAATFAGLVKEYIGPDKAHAVDLYVSDIATRDNRSSADVRAEAVGNFRKFTVSFFQWCDATTDQGRKPNEQSQMTLLGMFPAALDQARSGELTMSIRGAIARAETLWPDICKEVQDAIGISGESIKAMRDIEQAYDAAYEYLFQIVDAGAQKKRNPNNLKPRTNGQQRAINEAPADEPAPPDDNMRF